MSVILDESKFKLSDVRRNKGASLTVQKRLLEFIDAIDDNLSSQAKEIFFIVHSNGVTGFANKDKAFIMVDFYPNYISILYWTGAQVISGLAKGNWPDGTFRGSERVKIMEGPDENHKRRAVDYACKAFHIATKEWNLSH
jgi:hypothetical protein